MFFCLRRQMFCNLFVYYLLQPGLYLLPLSIEHSVHHGFLLRQETHIVCRKLVGCFLLFCGGHNVWLCVVFCCKSRTIFWKASC